MAHFLHQNQPKGRKDGKKKFIAQANMKKISLQMLEECFYFKPREYDVLKDWWGRWEILAKWNIFCIECLVGHWEVAASCDLHKYILTALR